jgi:hypothetical protein
MIPQLATAQFLIAVFPADSLRPAFQDLRASSGKQTPEMNGVVHGDSSRMGIRFARR